MIDRIYRQAVKVLIWLGCEDLLSQHEFNALLVLAKAYMTFEQFKEEQLGDAPMESRHRVFGPPNDSTLLRSCGLPQIVPCQWQRLFALYNRAWSTRTWVIYPLLFEMFPGVRGDHPSQAHQSSLKQRSSAIVCQRTVEFIKYLLFVAD